MIDDADIQHAAKELVDRHGDDAVAVARERVEILTKGPEKSGLNEALRVLSAVENLVAGKQG